MQVEGVRRAQVFQEIEVPNRFDVCARQRRRVGATVDAAEFPAPAVLGEDRHRLAADQQALDSAREPVPRPLQEADRKRAVVEGVDAECIGSRPR
jgi:hypothetical protein